MKKVNKLSFILLFALTALVAVSVFGFAGTKTANAYTDPLYRFEVAKYDVTYDIASNCSIAVTEELTISYLGVQSTGFIRDIPVNKGAQVRDVKVKKLVNGEEQNVYYDVYIEDGDFISVDIGDYTNKYRQSESYRLTYTYNITNEVVNKSMLPLNPIGQGWDCNIYNATVKLILPDGYTDAKCYYGISGSTTTLPFIEQTTDGTTVITTSIDKLDAYNGITFDLNFEKGAIKNFTDLTPYLFAVAGLVILAIVILLKLFVFNKNYLTPVVNYEAPNKMDPLIMGKLIDNTINNEDVTSLIFYWASKGYIKINFDDKDDPSIIRVMKSLPESHPAYEQLMYNNLFQRGEIIKPSQLKNSFYKTVEQVTSMVNKQTKGLYENKSITASVVFAVIGGLLLGFAPMLLAFMRISSKMLLLVPFIAVIPAFVINGLAQTLSYNRLKLSKNKFIGLSLGLAAICVVVGILYVMLVPTSIIGTGHKIVLYVVSSLVFTSSASLLMRSASYTEKLNDIIGFKNFIQLAEKDQLEMMLEEDPQFYYHILPYAQVLGVTDKWEEKFADITIQPPQWATGNVMTTYIEFRIINSMLRNSMRNISSGMVSRPSSSGSNGGGFGGGFGGRSGGGFGGGGGRGR